MTKARRRSQPSIDTTLIGLVLTGVGLVVTVATLDRAAGWKATALVAGAASAAMVVMSVRRPRWRLQAQVGAGVVLVAAAAILVLAPPPAQPEPQPELVVSKFQALAPSVDSGPQFDITLHNVGRRGVVLNEFTLRISEFAYLPWCAAEGTVQPSKPYPLVMPDDPDRGTKVSATLHEEVPAGRVDRFLIDVGAPAPRLSADGQPIAATFVYLANVSVTTDTTDPLALGSVAFATPTLPTTNVVVWDLSDPARDQVDWVKEFITAVPGFRECLDTNSKELSKLLEVPVDITQDDLLPAGINN